MGSEKITSVFGRRVTGECRSTSVEASVSPSDSGMWLDGLLLCPFHGKRLDDLLAAAGSPPIGKMYQTGRPPPERTSLPPEWVASQPALLLHCVGQVQVATDRTKRRSFRL
jgi:hypothetical protein